MNTLFVTLQAAAPAQQGGGMSMIIMIVLLFAVMYFFMIRPQKKQQKALQEFRNSLKRGDKIVTIGGIYGTVDEIMENKLVIIVDKDVKLRVSKNAVQKDFDQNAETPQAKQ
ncbi:MAG: preprotein translocase subunit YajC [Bacteroidales bacterium]|nr:preprotein translocase subunit YajC [Bacteroidales bacterium]